MRRAASRDDNESGRESAATRARSLARAAGADLDGVSIEEESPTETTWQKLAFSGPAPPPEVVAHELVHLAQAQRFPAATPPGGRAAGSAPDEREARVLAPLVAQGRSVDVAEAPSASRRGWTGTSAAEIEADKPGAQELREAIRGRRAVRVLEILAANQDPEHMAGIRISYGPALVRDLHWVLSRGRERSRWDVARIYLGDQLSLDEELELEERVFGGDFDRIMAVLRSRSDEEMLAVVAGREHFPGLLSVPPPGIGPEVPSFDALRGALDSALDGNEYYQAMRLVLSKSSRAHARQYGVVGDFLGSNEPSIQVELADSGGLFELSDLVLPGDLAAGGGIQMDASELTIEPDPDDPSFVPLLFDPGARVRVDLAVARVIDADENTEGWWVLQYEEKLLGRALLALAVLEPAERRAAWLQLRKRSWAEFDADDVGRLRQLCLAGDEVLSLGQAIIDADDSDAASSVDMKVAVGRYRELMERAAAGLRDARSEEETAHWERELDRLQSIARGPELQAAIGSWPDYGAALPSIGATPAEIGVQALRRVEDFGDLLRVVSGLSVEDRTDARFQYFVQRRALKLDLNARQQTLLDSYLNVGRDREGGDRLYRIALHEMDRAREDEEPQRALAVMHRMTDEQREGYVAWEPYRRWYKGLLGRAGIPVKLLHIWLEHANRGDTVFALKEAAIERSLYPDRPTRLRDSDTYAEYVSSTGESQRDRRRGYVLWSRLKSQPDLELSEADRALVAAYAEHNRLVGGIDSWKKRQLVEDVFVGQPQLAASEEGVVDPTTEADFMFYRLAQRKRMSRDWTTLATQVRGWSGDYLGSDVTAFLLTFAQMRPSGISRTDLAILADLYHRAMREADELKREADMAAMVASIVACVVAVAVVTVLSGGTLSGPAIAAVAALAGGMAAMTTGALLRTESSSFQLLRDFGTGAVEGAMAVAGAGIAARVVRMGQVGTTVSAAAAGGAAVKAATKAPAAARVATAVIDGAVSGAAGEVFRTATDEATWDRSVSEAFSRILGSLARGTVTGGIAGGVFGGAFMGLGAIARRFGDRSASRVADLVEGAGIDGRRLNELSEASHDALVRAERLAAEGDIDGALARVEDLRRVGDLSADELVKVERTLRAIRITEGAMQTGLERAEIVRRIQVVEPAEFRRIAQGARGNAVVKVTESGPTVFVRRGTDPLVVREEIIHLQQWATDPMMRARMTRLSEVELSPERLSKLEGAEVNDLYRVKLEVEADAQRRIIADLEGRGGQAAADEIAAAEDTLYRIGDRLDEVEAAIAGGRRLDLKPQDLRLYSKSAPTRPAAPEEAQNWRRVQREVLGENPNDPDVRRRLKKMGYVIYPADAALPVSKVQAPKGGRAANSHAHLSVGQTPAGPRLEPGLAGATHADRLADAGREMRARTRDIKRLRADIRSGDLEPEDLRRAHTELAALRPRLFDELSRRVANGHLDHEGAGMVARWGGVIDDLQRRTGRSYSDLLGEVRSATGKLRESTYDKFRRDLREIAADHIATVTPGRRQRTHLVEMLDLQPDNKSRGELFTAYRQATMKRSFPDESVRTGGKVETLQVPGSKTTTGRRTPDDVVDQDYDLDDFLPGGRWAVEDKAGNAFKLAQAQDYARALNTGPKNLRGEPVEYDGVVYVFLDEKYAKRAYQAMEADEITKHLVDRHPAGIHVVFLNEQGVLKRWRPAAPSSR